MKVEGCGFLDVFFPLFQVLPFVTLFGCFIRDLFRGYILRELNFWVYQKVTNGRSILASYLIQDSLGPADQHWKMNGIS